MGRGEKMTRVDENFIIKLNTASTNRVRNGLDKKNLGIRELTRMAQNTEAFNKMMFELETKPRRRKDE